MLCPPNVDSSITHLQNMQILTLLNERRNALREKLNKLDEKHDMQNPLFQPIVSTKSDQ